jgi:hypothetical protein
VWCCYRLTFDDDTSPAAALTELAPAVAAFADSILEHFAGNGSWVAASAHVKAGSMDVWFGMPSLPTDPLFGEIWRAQLRQRGLCGQRVPNRN